MKNIKLEATKRTLTGRKVKTLRSGGLIPSNVFGKGVKSEAISVGLSDFIKVFKEAGETSLINLEVTLAKDKKEVRPVLVSNVQKNPLTDQILHVDFYQVNLKEKVEASVPVEVIGESPAEKQSLGTVVLYMNEILVEALPADLPEKFEVDASTLTEVDQAVHIKDLKVDSSKVEIKVDQDAILVKVEPPQKEEVVEVVPEVVEGEEGATAPVAEGEAPQADTEKTEEPKA